MLASRSDVRAFSSGASMSGLPHAKHRGQGRALWRGRQDPSACLALDLKLLPIEEANQVVRLLEAESHQNDAAQAPRPALEGVVDGPARAIRHHVMPRQHANDDGWG